MWLQCLFGGRELAEGRPSGSGERMGLQETPSSWGLELKHSQALCRVTRGPAGGKLCPGLGLSHKPQFLSVVLKESVESADGAVLLHPRTVGLRLLAGRG